MKGFYLLLTIGCILMHTSETVGACTSDYDPACGTDGKTYPNECAFKNAQRNNPSLAVKHGGECEKDTRSNQENTCTCPRLYAPVCGSNGQTYANECLLKCAQNTDPSLTMRHRGPCKTRVERKCDHSARLSCPCPKNYKPICASNGCTYRNECLLQCAKNTHDSSIEKVRDGRCA